MNITTSKRDLLPILARAQGIAEAKSTMPVLSNVLLRTDGERVELAATDLYLSIRSSIPAKVDKAGSYAVPAKALFERVKAMPDGPIVFATLPDNTGMTIKSAGSARRYTMRGMPGDDFPPLPKPDEGAPTFSLAAGVLSRLINHTRFAISTDETRAHLNSALLEMEPGEIRMVATDGHRLSKYELAIEGAAAATMLIPLKAVGELQRLDEAASSITGDERPMLTLIQSGSSLFVQTGATTFSVRLVDAQFPPYKQVIPESVEKTFRLPRVALAEAVRAVAVSSGDKGGVKLSFAKGTLTLTSEDAVKGDGIDTVSYEALGADGARSAMNSKYLLDALAPLTADEVTIGVSAELDPMLLRAIGDDAYVGVLMPMRL